MGKIFPMIRTPRALTFTVERDAFLQAAAFLAKRIVERRNSIPILSNVLVTASADAVTLYGTDLDMAAALTVPATITSAGDAFTVPVETLADVVKSVGKGSLVTLSYDPATGRVVVTSGNTCTTLRTLPAADCPVLSDAAAAPVAVDLETLAGDLARLAPFMCSKGHRHYLRGVELARNAAGELTMTATNGSALARITRPMPEGLEAMESILMPAKAVVGLVKLAKGRTGSATLSIDAGKLAVSFGGATITTKAIDGSFPDISLLLERLEGAQRVAFIDLEPDLTPTDVETFRKVLGTVADVHAGDNCYSFTTAAAPEFLGIVSVNAADKVGKFQHAASDHAAAFAYMRDLARARGLSATITTEMDLRMRAGLVLGATFGSVVAPAVKAGDSYARPGTDAEYAAALEEAKAEGTDGTMPTRECFTVRDIAAAAIPARYSEGAFSVPMPRERADMAAAVVFHAEDGTGYPLRTIVGGNGITGAIELSAAAVARLAGDIDPATLVHIEAREYHHGAPLAEGWILPKPPKLKGAAALRMTAREMADYVDACRPVFTGAPVVEAVAVVEPAPQPEPIIAPVCQPAAPAPVEPAQAPNAAAPVADDVIARLAALEAIVARLTRPVEAGKRVRSEGERRAIIRAWEMRRTMRARAAEAAAMLERVTLEHTAAVEALATERDTAQELFTRTRNIAARLLDARAGTAARLRTARAAARTAQAGFMAADAELQRLAPVAAAITALSIGSRTAPPASAAAPLRLVGAA